MFRHLLLWHLVFCSFISLCQIFLLWLQLKLSGKGGGSSQGKRGGGGSTESVYVVQTCSHIRVP